jgi:hypothetical protein
VPRAQIRWCGFVAGISPVTLDAIMFSPGPELLSRYKVPEDKPLSLLRARFAVIKYLNRLVRLSAGDLLVHCVACDSRHSSLYWLVCARVRCWEISVELAAFFICSIRVLAFSR